jgi:hypothetical protein
LISSPTFNIFSWPQPISIWRLLSVKVQGVKVDVQGLVTLSFNFMTKIVRRIAQVETVDLSLRAERQALCPAELSHE